jgi:hypothetical protein
MLAPLPAAQLAHARILGIAKKREYLSALEDKQLKDALRELGVQEQKLFRTRAKLQRPKNAGRAWPDHEVQRMVGVSRTDRWRKRRERWGHTHTQIVTFHDYGRYDPVRDFLWWDVMTDGRLDGDFIPEVHARGPRVSDHHHDHARHEPEPTWRDDHTLDAS